MVRAPLVRAVAGGDVDAVSKLIEAGADINGLYYWSPRIEAPPGLHGAAVYVPSSPDSAHSGNTPLMLAAGRGNAIMVHLLLEKGANPNLRRSLDDKGRSSALCKAVAGHSNQEALKLILSRHPDTESVETAFASIADNKYTLMSYIDIFLKHGISVQCRQQVLMKVKKGGNKHIAYLLEEAYQKHDKTTQKKE
jgi:ankyrin repeat protein